MEYSGGPESDSKKTEIKRILARHEVMAAARATAESTWQECMQYIVPRKGDVTTTLTPGDKRGHELYDTTAIMSNELLAGALHSWLTNQSSQFFEMTVGDPTLDDDEEVLSWLQAVTTILHDILNGSNFHTETHEVYIDLGAIGNACLYTGEHEANIAHFAARSMKEIYTQENNLGLIDIVHRSFKWNLRQIVQEFGEKSLNDRLLEKYKKGCEDPFEILHAVEPNPEKGARLPISSRYILKDEMHILHSGGFKEFPFAVPRWTKTSGESTGRGPGQSMLPDIKMVNEMMRTTLEGAQLTVRPAYGVEDDGVVGKVRLTPGGLTVIRAGSKDPVRRLTEDSRVDFGYQVVEDVRKRIRAGFYTDKIQLNDGPQKTATEVNQIVEESMRYMGPILGRQHFEFLKPVVERVYGIASRRKVMRNGQLVPLLPPAPKKIDGRKIDVRYSSMLARAQRMNEGSNIMRAFNAIAPIVNAAPATLDNIDTDKSVKHILSIYGVPQKLLRDQRTIKKMRDDQAAAQQQAAAEAQEAHQAEVVGKVGPSAVMAAQAQAGGR